MITFNKDTKIVHLSNKNLSYMIYINDAGYLETLYFGKAMGDLRESDCIRKSAVFHDSGFYYNTVARKEERFSDHFKNDCAPLEISPHGSLDKRGAPLVIRRRDGSFETDFVYQSHQIYKGVKPIAGLPHATGENCYTVEFRLKEKSCSLYLDYFLTIFEDKSIILKSFNLTNEGEDEVKILRACSMQLDLPHPNFNLVHFKGRWQKEKDYCENPLFDGIQEISSNLGRSSHEENPFVYLKEKGATDEHGEVFGFNLIYSGNFKFRVNLTKFASPHITYGINDEDFEWTLGKGESFPTPQAVISYSREGVGAMSRTFHDFIRENLIQSKLKNQYKPILFNSWEGCYFDFDTDRVISYINDGIKVGTELFVLDDGWFGKRNNDDAGLGDWKVNTDKIDLHKIFDHCKEKGIKLGIWFEPEMINYDSDLFREKPHYVLGDINSPTLSCIRHQFHLDFANPEVVENIYRQLKTFLDEYPVDYIKWDYNRIVAEHFSSALPSSRQGEVYHRLTLGYYSLLSRIVAEYPDMMIEGCASGGGRFDMGTLFYTPQIWASDESDPAQRMEINYNTSLGYPLCVLGAHVNENPITSYRTKAILALFGTYGYEMNPNRLTKDEIEELSEIAKVYKEYHQKVIEEGDLYHILSPNESNFTCMQAVSKDKNISLAVIMNRKKELDSFRFIKLKGLDSQKLYHNDFDNTVHSGEYLMNIGLNYSREWIKEFTCKLVIIKEA